MEYNYPIAYALGLEFHHLIMGTLGVHEGYLERVRDIKTNRIINR